MFFLNYLGLFITYLPTYLLTFNIIIQKLFSFKYKFDKSNGPLFISQIVNHFLNQNDMVQIDYYPKLCNVSNEVKLIKFTLHLCQNKWGGLVINELISILGV
jgi:hypothetical protein